MLRKKGFCQRNPNKKRLFSIKKIHVQMKINCCLKFLTHISPSSIQHFICSFPARVYIVVIINFHLMLLVSTSSEGANKNSINDVSQHALRHDFTNLSSLYSFNFFIVLYFFWWQLLCGHCRPLIIQLIFAVWIVNLCTLFFNIIEKIIIINYLQKFNGTWIK